MVGWEGRRGRGSEYRNRLWRIFTSTCLWRWNKQSVPKRWHVNSRRRVITQKKAYNILFFVKVEFLSSTLYPTHLQATCLQCVRTRIVVNSKTSKSSCSFFFLSLTYCTYSCRCWGLLLHQIILRNTTFGRTPTNEEWACRWDYSWQHTTFTTD